jgi:lipopolysaccharide biosynthesis glycosyltransferase
MIPFLKKAKYMQFLVVTRADDNIREMTNITHPIIKNYCIKIGADFRILNQESECKEGKRKNHYRITEIRNLLEKYDRVLCLDSDIIINKNCPNIFDEVPYNRIGTIFEDKGSRTHARRYRMGEIQDRFGDVNWNSGYINTGVFVVSKIHKDIFLPINNEFWMKEGEDDVHIGYNIHKFEFKIFELNFKWNHMTMFSEGWNNHANRFGSYIIHYAGSGLFNSRDRMEQILSDKRYIWG